MTLLGRGGGVTEYLDQPPAFSAHARAEQRYSPLDGSERVRSERLRLALPEVALEIRTTCVMDPAVLRSCPDSAAGDEQSKNDRTHRREL